MLTMLRRYGKFRVLTYVILLALSVYRFLFKGLQCLASLTNSICTFLGLWELTLL